MNKIQKKLSSSKGETIAEVLVASLIAALAMLLLATMVMSATHIVTKSETSMNKVYTSISQIEGETIPGSPDKISITVKRGDGTAISVNNVPKYVNDDNSLMAYELE